MKKIIIAFSLFALVLSPSLAHAVALAKFPDPRDNQPLPAEAHPNISHNVQANDQIAPGMEIEPDKPKTDIILNEPGAQEEKKSHGFWWLVAAIAAALAGYGIYRSRKDTF